MLRVDWRAAGQCGVLSALSIGLFGWFLAMLRGPWQMGLIPVSVFTGLTGAALAVRKAQFGKAATALVAFMVGILLALAEGILIVVTGLALLAFALAD